MVLYVLNPAKNAIGAISGYTNDQHVMDLSLGASTFTFDISKDEFGTENLKTGNYLILHTQGRNFVFYIIKTTITQNNINVYSADAGITLINRMCDVVNETTAQPIDYYVNDILKGTDWKIGVNELSNEKRALTFTSQETGLKRLLEVLNEFDNAEVEFVVTLNGTQVDKWNVNIRKKIGTQRDDIQIDYNDTLNNITRTEDRSTFITALAGQAQNNNDNTTTTTKSTSQSKKGALALVSLNGAQRVINDMRKYLGVKYKWGGNGGSRGGNPMDGMDCSSYVSQVYLDFGIKVPAYTVSLEKCGYDIPMSQVQTGDMLFYSKSGHGASYHVALAIDNKNMIFEPEPGEVCKEEPISAFPPNWAERNPEMAKIVEGNNSNNNNDNSKNDSSNQDNSKDNTQSQAPMTFKDIDYPLDKDGFFSPKGDPFLYAKKNNDLYNNGGYYIQSYYQSEASTPQSLLTETLAQLKKLSVPALSYECDVSIVDPSIKLGDTITIIDASYNPAVYLRARVIQLTRSYTNNTQNKIVFGNYQLLQSSINKNLKDLQEQIKQLQNGIANNADNISNVSSTVTNVSSAVTSAVKHVNSISSNVGSMTSQVEKTLSGIHYNVASLQSAVSQAGGKGNTNYYGNSLQSGTDFKKGDLDFVTDKNGVTTIYVWDGTKWVKLVDDSDNSQVSAIVASAEKAVYPMVSTANSAVSAADANIKKIFGTLNSQQNSVSSLNNSVSSLYGSITSVAKSASEENNSLINQASSLAKAVSANGLSIKTNADTLNIYDADIKNNAGSITAIQTSLGGIQTTVDNYKGTTDQEISSIKQTAEEIHDTVIDNTNKIGTLSTSVKQNANQINTTVEQVTKQVTENINKNQVVNCVANSELIMNNKDQATNPSIPKPNSFREPYCWHAIGWDVEEGQDFNGEECIEISYDGDTTYNGYSTWYSDPISINQSGSVFSASIRLYIQRSDFVALSVKGFDSKDQELHEWGFNSDFSKTYQWQLATMENVTIPADVVYLKFFVYSEPQSINDFKNLVIEVNKPMLTFTSKLYPYTPSKDNFVKDANNREYVQTSISTVNQTIKEISTTVSQNTQTGNTNTSKISQLKTSISGISANVSEIQDGVTQKVSSINQNIDNITSTIASFKNGVNTKYSSLSQKVDGFQSTVDEVGSMSSRITQLDNTIQTAMTDAQNNQSKITQLSNNIDLRISKAISNSKTSMSKSQIISEINLDDNGVYIEGKNIHLNGQTIVDEAFITSADIVSLSADKITSGRLDCGNLTVVNLNGKSIAANSITADQIQSGDILVALRSSLHHVDIQPDNITILKDNNDPIIQLNTTGLMINGSNNQQVFKLDQSGITVSNPDDENNSMIGLFHTNHIYQHPEWAGIDLDLNPEYGGKYIGFGCYHNKTQFYDLEFAYTEDPDIFGGNTGIICKAPTTFLNQIYLTNTFIRAPGVGTQLGVQAKEFWFNNTYYTGIEFITNNGDKGNGFIVTDQGEPFFIRQNQFYPLKGILLDEGYPGVR